MRFATPARHARRATLAVLAVCSLLAPATPLGAQRAAAAASAAAQAAPSAAALRAAYEYHRGARGHAMLVWHRDSLVLERYDAGWTAERAHMLASGTKSFAGLMAGAAADDGLLTLDEPVARTLTEWRDDPRRSRITIRQLLGLTSGIDGGNVGRRPRGSRDNVDLPARWEPGTTFRYAQEPFQLFHEVMRRKLAARGTPQAPTDWLQSRLLAPMGVKVARWARARDGTPSLAGGGFMTARDWGTVGRMLAAGGTWDGRPLVRQATLAELLRGSEALPAYGVSFWLNAPMPAGSVSADEYVPIALGRRGSRAAGEEALMPGGPRDLFMAAGAGNQRLYVVPSRQLVIVRFGDARGLRGDRAWADAEFLGRALGAR